jgi:hypothetical protein
MPRKPSDATEFQARVALDNEMVRGKIPSPLLRQMGARPGDYMTFRLCPTGEALMRVSRAAVESLRRVAGAALQNEAEGRILSEGGVSARLKSCSSC